MSTPVAICLFLILAASMPLALLLVWYRQRTRHAGLWALGFALIPFCALGHMLVASGRAGPAVLAATAATVALALGLTYLGCRAFPDGRLPSAGAIGAVAAVVLSSVLVIPLLGAGHPLAGVPMGVILSGGMVAITVRLWRVARRERYQGAAFAGIAFAGQAALNLIYPVSMHVPWLHAAGFALAGICTLFQGLGLLVLALEHEHRQTLQQTERLARDVESREAALAEARSLAAIGKVADAVVQEVNERLGEIDAGTSLLVQHVAGEPEVRQTESRIRRAVEETERLMKDLVEGAATPPVWATVDLAATIAGIAVLTGGTRVRLDQEWPEPPLPIVTDRRRVEQILINLVQNAIEAMPQGGTVTVRVTRSAGTTITVRDNGPGMAPAVLARLFKGVFTTKPDGNGLGLLIARSLARSLGGSLEVASTVGYGTTVTLHLPERPPLDAT